MERTRGRTQMVEHLLSKYRSLNSKPSAIKKKEEKINGKKINYF
jgi:hypothetical protein